LFQQSAIRNDFTNLKCIRILWEILCSE
jgi:hypothetical protein